MHCDLAQAREAITAHQIDRHVPDLLVVEGQLAAADGDVAVWAGPQCPEIAVLKWALVFGLGLLVLTFQTPDGNCSSARAPDGKVPLREMSRFKPLTGIVLLRADRYADTGRRVHVVSNP